MMSPKIYQSAAALYCRLFVFIKPFWPILVLGILANLGYAAIDALFTYLMRSFFDKGFIHTDLAYIQSIPFLVLMGISLRGLLNSLGGYCMTWVARSVVRTLRSRVFAHILRLPADGHDELSSGQLLSKILYDVEQVAQVSADVLTDFVQNTCLIIALMTVMVVVSWQLSLIFFLLIPFIAAIVHYTNKRVRRISHKIQNVMTQVTDIAVEAIEGYQVVRIFGGEDYETKKFNQATRQAWQQDLKVALSKAINVSGVQIIIGIGIALIVFAAIQLMNQFPISPGSFLAIMVAILQLIKPMKTLTTLNSSIQRGLAGAESVFALLDSPVEADHGLILKKKARGAIVYQGVSCAYRTGDKVLEDINFSIEPGETVALVGHSGSGKTTLINLLPRFYPLTQGTILLDGTSIAEISLKSLRAQIALVSQNVTLFNDSLANNIAYGCFEASREAIMAAAKLAYADEFIDKLPEGYDTLIGENGLMLSGGQRQRLAIARAILKDAPILILDEATSALDAESERYIQLALEQITKNRTTLVIAHRLSTIQRASKIIVIHQGRVVEQGTHQDLLLWGHHYGQLYSSQASYANSELGAY